MVTVTHRSSSRLISLPEQPYSAAKPAVLVSKDLNFSVKNFEVMVGIIGQLLQGLFSLVTKPWVPSPVPAKLCGAHSYVRCTWEVEAGR